MMNPKCGKIFRPSQNDEKDHQMFSLCNVDSIVSFTPSETWRLKDLSPRVYEKPGTATLAVGTKNNCF